MLSLSAKIRKELGKKSRALRKKGVLPAVLYGPKLKENLLLELDEKKFEKVLKEAGESSLISLEAGGKVYLVLIHEIQLTPLTEKVIHVDFYQPSLKEEVEVTVPLFFGGVAPAVRDLGGTLIKNIQEVTVKALPQNLPHEIKVNVEKLKTFEDNILIKDLIMPRGGKILKEAEEIIALVSPLEKIEEELAKPVEEKIEEVEKVEEKKEKEEEGKEESGESK